MIQFFDLPHWFIPWLIEFRFRGIPLVYVHTMIRDPSISRFRLIKDALWHLPRELMNVVVVSSGVMKEELQERGIRTPIEVIPNGVDLHRFRPVGHDMPERAARKQLGLPPEAEVLLFVGGFLERRKGLDVLAEAWVRVSRERPKAHLVLVGPTLDRFRAEAPQREFVRSIEAVLRASEAFDRVTFAGRVDNVERYLQVADVFVFPSRREGMPNVVPEAFACGAACILTPFLGLPDEFGRAGEHYLLVDRTAGALSNAINDLLDNRERRLQLGRAARRWVEKELDVERSLDLYAGLYRSMAEVGLEGEP